MSNYSDFFGVGSSGGGGSVPINSYLPFLVSGTGNPTGYDAATGLYTHPDGTYWVRTGFQVPGASYPSATSTFSLTANPAPYGPDHSYIGADFSNNDHYFVRTTAGNLVTYDFNHNLINDYGASPLTIRSLCKTATNIYLADNSATATITEYDLTLTPTGNTIATGIVAYSIFIKNASTISCYGNGGVIRDFSLTTYAQTKSVSSAGGTFQAGGGYKSGLYIGTNTFSPTDVFSQNDDGSAANPSTYSIPWAGSAKHIAVTENYIFALTNSSTRSNPWNSAVGDSTARTDTDTSQPLFMRVG